MARDASCRSGRRSPDWAWRNPGSAHTDAIWFPGWSFAPSGQQMLSAVSGSGDAPWHHSSVQPPAGLRVANEGKDCATVCRPAAKPQAWGRARLRSLTSSPSHAHCRCPGRSAHWRSSARSRRAQRSNRRLAPLQPAIGSNALRCRRWWSWSLLLDLGERLTHRIRQWCSHRYSARAACGTVS